MSFQTFNLFGFYQQPNTGSFPPPDSFDENFVISGGNQRSGTAAEFNWFFPYAESLVPIQVIKGGIVPSPIKLFSDSDIGARHPFFNINLSGRLFEDFNLSKSEVFISGNFIPKDADETSSTIVFSGLINPDKPDLNSSYILISGDIFDPKSQNTFIITNISGEVLNSNIDFFNTKTIISGIITGDSIDFPIVKITVSGKFFKSYFDESNLNYIFSGYSIGKNYEVIKSEFEDNIQEINYTLKTYSATK